MRKSGGGRDICQLAREEEEESVRFQRETFGRRHCASERMRADPSFCRAKKQRSDANDRHPSSQTVVCCRCGCGKSLIGDVLRSFKEELLSGQG